jgi:hypothetical protein
MAPAGPRPTPGAEPTKVEALSEEFEGGLVRALRKGIAGEKAQRSVFSVPQRTRPVFRAFGTAAME